MSNFEKIAASPETLGMFLASLQVANSPWEKNFKRSSASPAVGKIATGSRVQTKAHGTIRHAGWSRRKSRE